MNQRYGVIKEYVNRHAKGQIADLGIGKGYYYYKSKAKNVEGVDLNGNNLRKLKSHSPFVITYHRDVREPVLRNDYYDLVIISQVIEHFEDYQPIIEEAKRICKKDGYYLIGTPVNAPHKLHFHPKWDYEDIIKLGEDLGTILEIRKFPDHWLLYVKRI